MAGGWAREGAVQDQIDASIADELARLRARPTPAGEAFSECAECGDEIPEARRQAVPGVKLCLACQQARDGRFAARPGIDRRRSKDSALK